MLVNLCDIIGRCSLSRYYETAICSSLQVAIQNVLAYCILGNIFGLSCIVSLGYSVYKYCIIIIVRVLSIENGVFMISPLLFLN